MFRDEVFTVNEVIWRWDKVQLQSTIAISEMLTGKITRLSCFNCMTFPLFSEVITVRWSEAMWNGHSFFANQDPFVGSDFVEQNFPCTCRHTHSQTYSSDFTQQIRTNFVSITTDADWLSISVTWHYHTDADWPSSICPLELSNLLENCRVGLTFLSSKTCQIQIVGKLCTHCQLHPMQLSDLAQLDDNPEVNRYACCLGHSGFGLTNLWTHLLRLVGGPPWPTFLARFQMWTPPKAYFLGYRFWMQTLKAYLLG